MAALGSGFQGFPVDVPVTGTFPGCVSQIGKEDRNPGHRSLVEDKRPKLSEAPFPESSAGRV
jgi:hypothetical protein